jgi:two-component system, cell cycle sensor histidine kinase and response regulator CckA
MLSYSTTLVAYPPDRTVPTDTEPPPVILVVDDEPAVNRLVTRYLSHLGYRVLDARSAAEALSRVRRQEPRIDLVLCDVVMPGVGGVELAEVLLSRAPGPSVILMTGQLQEGIERLDVNGQTVRVLRKPLDLDQLQQVLQVTLEGYPAEDAVDSVDRAS